MLAPLERLADRPSITASTRMGSRPCRHHQSQQARLQPTLHSPSHDQSFPGDICCVARDQESRSARDVLRRAQPPQRSGSLLQTTYASATYT